MRLGLRKHLCLVHRLAHAQRNHYLQASALLVPNSILKKSLLSLLRCGLVLHYYPKGLGLLRGATRVPFYLILRYWEGQPLVSVGAAPKLRVGYKSLQRRFKHGGGVTFLVWSSGSLLTSDECLEQKTGGVLCLSVVS
jgi:hypothetical protein